MMSMCFRAGSENDYEDSSGDEKSGLLRPDLGSQQGKHLFQSEFFLISQHFFHPALVEVGVLYLTGISVRSFNGVPG